MRATSRRTKTMKTVSKMARPRRCSGVSEEAGSFSGGGAVMQANFYYTTGGSYIEMRFKPDSGNCKQFIINQTSPQYTTAGSFIEGPNIKAVTSPSAVGSGSLAVFVRELGRRLCPNRAWSLDLCLPAD